MRSIPKKSTNSNIAAGLVFHSLSFVPPTFMPGKSRSVTKLVAGSFFQSLIGRGCTRGRRSSGAEAVMRSVPSVMRHGYGDELFQAWRDGKIRQKDLPEVVAMTLDLCERWRAEQERCKRVHAAQRLSRDPGPSRSRSRSRSRISCRSSVSGCDEGEGTD